MEQKPTNLNKLKNKKKDVIKADNINAAPINKPDENISTKNILERESTLTINSKLIENPLLVNSNNKENTDKDIENKINTIDNSKNDSHGKTTITNKEKKSIEFNTEKQPINNEHSNNDTKKEINKSNSDENKNSNVINKIIFNIHFNIQLFLSSKKKINRKLFDILMNFLSIDHLKAILEERDCIGLCGNILCDKVIEKRKTKKSFYNSQLKDFVKDDVLGYFCDIKCFQLFKDAIKLSNNFDYLRLFKFESLFIFFNLKNYFSDEIYMKKISSIVKPVYENTLKNVDELTFDLLKTKYDNYFNDLNKIECNNTLNGISNEDKNIHNNNIDLNKVFEEKIHLQN